MNNPQEKEELEHKYLCLTMNNSISNNMQELSKKENHYTKYTKAHYEANKEKAIAQNQTWAENNREKTRAYNKDWRERNKQLQTESYKEKKRDYYKTYQEANKEKIRSYYKEWNESKRKDTEHQAKLARDRKQRYENDKKDPLTLAKFRLRKAVQSAFERIKQNKPADTQTLLGCTWEEAKAHFESLFQEGMSWSNHGEWHIDHIRPVSSFGPDELKIMNHISNLQPLWAKDNLTKSDVY